MPSGGRTLATSDNERNPQPHGWRKPRNNAKNREVVHTVMHISVCPRRYRSGDINSRCTRHDGVGRSVAVDVSACRCLRLPHTFPPASSAPPSPSARCSLSAASGSSARASACERELERLERELADIDEHLAAVGSHRAQRGRRRAADAPKRRHPATAGARRRTRAAGPRDPGDRGEAARRARASGRRDPLPRLVSTPATSTDSRWQARSRWPCSSARSADRR